MKEFHCGTICPGCQWHTLDEDVDAIVGRALAHLRSAHGSAAMGPGTVGLIRSHIHAVHSGWPGVRAKTDLAGWSQHLMD